MSRNSFWDELEPERLEPVNPFLYPERVEQRAKTLEQDEDDPPKRKRGRPRK